MVTQDRRAYSNAYTSEKLYDNDADRIIRLFVEEYEKVFGLVYIPKDIDKDLAEEFEEINDLIGLFDDKAIEQWRNNLTARLQALCLEQEIQLAMLNFMLAVEYFWQVDEQEDSCLLDDESVEEDFVPNEKLDDACIEMDERFAKVLRLISAKL